MSKEAILFLIIVSPILIFQATYAFRDAMKRGIPNPWIWGIICLLNTPTNILIYLVYRDNYLKKKNKKRGE